MGDWYAQKMYQTGSAVYKWHCEHYAHPSKFGFKDVINEWKADQWDPKYLISLYKKAGAKFFAAMANHHDNLDMFDSTYQPWNSIRVGPKKDIVGGWMKEVRAADLRFAISCHGDRSWDWMQVSQGADSEGPYAGIPYDGLLTKAEGKGKWWDGLDPQDLYAQYHVRGSYGWNLSPRGGGRGPRGAAGAPAQASTTPPVDPKFIEKFFNRTVDLINKYQPDLLYFDDTIMPIWPSSDIGPRIAAYLYNTNMARNGGKLECLMTGKGLSADWKRALVNDIERGVAGGGEPLPWQTDTCIGSWHYEKAVFDNHRYKTALQVTQMLIDIVSKNGQLMLSVPLKGNGTLDSDELKVLDGLASWIAPNGEAIYATRPWKVYGEGPSTDAATQARGQFGGARDVRAYTAEDFRFTCKGETVYAFMMAWPENGTATIKSLAQGGEHFPKQIARVELLGAGEVKFTRDANGLVVNLPEKKPNDYAYAFKITAA
jgi:alpha-L-fucosidase